MTSEKNSVSIAEQIATEIKKIEGEQNIATMQRDAAAEHLEELAKVLAPLQRAYAELTGASDDYSREHARIDAPIKIRRSGKPITTMTTKPTKSASGAPKRSKGERGAVGDAILDVLGKGKPLSKSAIEEKVGDLMHLKDQAISSTLARLKKQGKVEYDDENREWSLA